MTSALIGRLPPIPSVRDLVKLYRLKAIKQLSQNFLLDEKLTSKIVKHASYIQNSYVCEVGPGPGGITRSILAKQPKKLILIEKDPRFKHALELLRSAVPAGVVDIHYGDVLSFEMSKMFPQEAYRDWDDVVPPMHIIGNLPFNVATPLIIKWLRAMSTKSNAWAYGRVPLTLTFQLEVAERLVAEPEGRQRCRLSVMAQHLCQCYHKFTIKGSSFVPKPDVDVGVVKFIPRKVPLINHDFSLIEKVVRQTFCMRGKYCRKPVSTLFPESVRMWFTKELLGRSRVGHRRRPTELTMEEFASLCDTYAEICKQYPQLKDYDYRGFKADELWNSNFGHAFTAFESEPMTYAKAFNDTLDNENRKKDIDSDDENEYASARDSEADLEEDDDRIEGYDDGVNVESDPFKSPHFQPKRV